MNAQHFSLTPFPTGTPLPEVEILSSIVRNPSRLTISYLVTGAVENLAIPSSAHQPIRKDGLWEETCFEFFLGVPDSPNYWEFNLSPAGHWNVYRFEDYRHGMQEENLFDSLSFQTEVQPDAFSLALELDLAKLLPEEQTLEVAISTVIKPKKGTPSYWALTHAGSEADFHRRDCFVAKV
jgi:hypothetical protein